MFVRLAFVSQGPRRREVIPIRRRSDSEDVSLWGSTKSLRELVLAEEEGDGASDESDEKDCSEQVGRYGDNGHPNNYLHTASHRS